MTEEVTDITNPIIVKESPTINFILAAVFFMMFIGSLSTIDYLPDDKKYLIPGSFAFFSFLFLANGIRKNIIIEINEKGIFYRRSLITDWSNFESAIITEAEIPGSTKDTFILVVQYYVPANGKYYISNLRMSDSQDKSEEEIMASINYFISKK